MYLLKFPDFASPRKLVFYLSVEEYLSSNLDKVLPGVPSGDRAIYFLWGSTPTVIFGRNQVMEREVNVPYCQEHGIEFFRRKSGGGCVYSDEGNIMVSFVCSDTDVARVFSLFQDRLCACFRSLGLPAERSERNDVLVGGKKVCGGAFLLMPSSSVVHSTLLFDSDFSVLEKAITPSQEKIESKGVKSVRQHVANLADFLRESPDPAVRELTDKGKFLSYLEKFLTSDGPAFTLTLDQLSAIDEIERTYLDPSFIQGKTYTQSEEIVTKGKFPRCGEVSCRFKVKDGAIVSMKIDGDFFCLGSRPQEELESVFTGCPLRKEDVMERIEAVDIGQYIMNLGSDEFLSLFPLPGNDSR